MIADSAPVGVDRHERLELAFGEQSHQSGQPFACLGQWSLLMGLESVSSDHCLA